MPRPAESVALEAAVEDRRAGARVEEDSYSLDVTAARGQVQRRHLRAPLLRQAVDSPRRGQAANERHGHRSASRACGARPNCRRWPRPDRGWLSRAGPPSPNRRETARRRDPSSSRWRAGVRARRCRAPPAHGTNLLHDRTVDPFVMRVRGRRTPEPSTASGSAPSSISKSTIAGLFMRMAKCSGD